MLRTFLLFSCILVWGNFTQGFSAEKSNSPKKKVSKQKKPSSATIKYADFVIDIDANKVLKSTYADSIRYPASITKLMTLYLTFQALKQGKLSLDEKLEVSLHAASQQRMNLSLQAGAKISVKDLINSLVVVSANDSAVVLAERIAVTEGNFAIKMTEKAKQLGMNSTTFKNASGLPNLAQKSTARDLAKLMIALWNDFPEYFNMLSVLTFHYNGVVYQSHTNVMKAYSYAKAGKTGYIRASGFNLVIAAEKGNKRIVAVVMGGATAKARDDKMIALLNQFL